MNMGEKGLGNVEREQKHIQIDSALHGLENEVQKIRSFISVLSEEPTSDGEDSAKRPMPNFLEVYNK